MRVLFVSNLYPPNVVGGYERLCFEVASAFAKAGHIVSVLTSDFGSKRSDYPGQTIRRTLRLLTGASVYEPFAGHESERAAINASNVEVLRATCGQTSPDMIYAWNLFFLDRSLLDALAASGIPVAVMLTDNWLANMIAPEYVAGFFRRHVFGNDPFPVPEPRRAGLLARLLGSPAPSAAAPMPETSLPVAAIYGSAFVQRFYRSAGLRFAREAVIHNGVSLPRLEPSAFRLRSEPVKTGQLHLLFAGRLVDLKGAETVIAALKHLREPLFPAQDVHLTLVGDEQDVAYVGRLSAAIAAYAGFVSIERRSTVPEAGLFELFSGHDIYLFPSLYEPFSLTLIHALACGIPTIASDAGGNVEIIEDGRSGLIFAKGDAVDLARSIERLVADPTLRERLSQGGRDAAARFGLETMVGRTETFFQDLGDA